ncbi:hypothetical protein TCAL_08179 [Tigriopus californicus]|uniref:Chitin-binding type-2 domain-containing protein n=1 Tax=Tigriopus californicus TaxID=6832 RepID=A0A553P659_TIGCA|nr:hypothetical protein TCAL_08179 [Tigriopus californicus]
MQCLYPVRLASPNKEVFFKRDLFPAQGYGTPICYVRDEGLFKINPSDCTIFYRCSGYKAHRFTCPSGLYFNPKNNVCDWPYNVNCGSHGYRGSQPSQGSHSSQASQSSQGSQGSQGSPGPFGAFGFGSFATTPSGSKRF